MVIMAEVTGKTFSQAAIIHMVESIDDLEFQSVANALKNWSRTERNFPHPSDIREKVMPELNPEDDAQDVASLILSGIGRYGYTNADRARTYIGELGWVTVARMGGWKHLCESVTIQNENSYRAQIRDLARTITRRAKRGELDQAPALPGPAGSTIKNLISNTMKGIDHD